MSNTKHTPGCWKIGPMNRISSGSYVVGDTNRVCVVDKNEHTEANARLIAAAPELLDALKRIFELIDEGKIGRDTSRDHDPQWVLQAMDVVVGLKLGHDAIAKAEGSDGEQEETREHG